MTGDRSARVALAHARARAGALTWQDAELVWADATTPENLDALANLAPEAGIPGTLVRIVVFRPMVGQRVRTFRGEGEVIRKFSASRYTACADDETEFTFSPRLASTRVLDPLTWLSEHPGGLRWGRDQACPKHHPKGTANPGQWCYGCNPQEVCPSCGALREKWRNGNPHPFGHHSFCDSAENVAAKREFEQARRATSIRAIGRAR